MSSSIPSPIAGFHAIRPPDLGRAQESKGLRTEQILYDAARTTERAIQIAPGFRSRYERLRLKAMLATILGRAGESANWVEVVRETIEEAQRFSEEVGGQRWMLDVSAAYAFAVWAGHGEGVEGMPERAQGHVRGEVAPGWRWQMLAAEGVCQIQAGRHEAGAPLLREATQVGAQQPGMSVYQKLNAFMDH